MRWLVLCALALATAIAGAQGFPERPIRIIVPLPPGGSPDTIARVEALPHATTGGVGMHLGEVLPAL